VVDSVTDTVPGSDLRSRPWRVGVISTDYDLSALRKALVEDLRRKGFSVVSFREPEYPVQPFMHSHDSCIKAVEAMDIVILLLDRRYGGLYLGSGPESVTEKEFRAAYATKKVLIPCVSRKLFDDRHKCKKRVLDLCLNGARDEDAKLAVAPEYAENWHVIEFLDRLQHMDRDQFMEFYTGRNTLLKQVHSRLEALTTYFCSAVVEKQISWLDAQHSTSGLFESIGQVGSPKLYVSPPAKIHSGGGSNRKASSIIGELLRGDKGVLVTGQPGVGKTVEVSRAFKVHARAIALKASHYSG
jgi:hypothetical protein